MSANSFGQHLKMTTFGESHGPAYGVILEGLPAGMNLDLDLLHKNLARRKPGQNAFVTARQEPDTPEILSGFYKNKSLGTPVAVVVKNINQRSEDYAELENLARNGHADDTWKNKFGHVDHRGGGRSSGRETLCRVIAGSFAQMFLQDWAKKNKVPLPHLRSTPLQIGSYVFSETEKYQESLPQAVQKLLTEAKAQGESYGGTLQTEIKNCPAYLGQPIFHKFKADLAQAVLSIGATTGFEFGAGFSGVVQTGSHFHQNANSMNYGGIRGGITTGEDIVFRTAFKPTSSIMDVAKKGRHDPCILPRATPVVEAMAWFVLADHVLWTRLDQI